MSEKPHLINGTPSTATAVTIAVTSAHTWHDGVAFFPDCPECARKMAAGEYPHWQAGSQGR